MFDILFMIYSKMQLLCFSMVTTVHADFFMPNTINKTYISKTGFAKALNDLLEFLYNILGVCTTIGILTSILAGAFNAMTYAKEESPAKIAQAKSNFAVLVITTAILGGSTFVVHLISSLIGVF